MAARVDREGTPGDTRDEEWDAAKESSAGAWLRELAFAPHVEPPCEERVLTGETLGRFQITGLLGRGGMGVVYAAVDLTLRRKIALKLLPAAALQSAERRQRFLREARSAAAVSHPNIAAIFDAGEIDGAVFIAMERVEGRSLRAVMAAAGAALPEAEAVRVAQGIARGLAAAHDAGVIHRDIKPENVMISDAGEVKLLDFGLAKLRGGALDHGGASASSDFTTREGHLLGTPSYMAPEQARGLEADARSDVFALGIVLFEMLARERPFRGATATDVLAAILRDAPPRLLSRNGSVSRAMEGVIARCLAKDPEERYAHAGSLLAALDAVARTSAGVRARPSRRLLGPWLALPIVGAAIAAAGATLRTSTPSPRPPDAGASTPAPRPTAITDLPLPPSSSPEAIAAYQVALRSFRDASWGQAQTSLVQAVKLDPTLAAAHLRLALIMSYLTFTSLEARAAYREATRYRSSLTPRDRALLAALEPSLGADPADVAETTRRFADLAERYPLDAEIFNLLGAYRRIDGPELRLAAARRAVEIDPEYADAWQQIGAALAGTDPDAAIVALDRCTAIAPSATDCWGERASLESALGRCADAEAHLRRATSDPGASEHHFHARAHMLYALGKPREAVAEALRQRWARLDPPAAREEEELHDGALLAAAYGDFEAARAQAERGLERADAHSTLEAHARFALLWTEIELEMGRSDAAAKVASRFLARRDAWHLGVPTEDPTMYLARVVARTHAPSAGEVRERRDAWVRAAMPVTPIQKAEVWGIAYAEGIERADEAAEALAARPEGARWPVFHPSLDASLGRALWLGGQRDDALPHLSRTSTRCDRFPTLFATARSNLLFARALEDQGERDRACAVYRTVLARWDHAKPRSVTGDEARRRGLALRCELR